MSEWLIKAVEDAAMARARQELLRYPQRVTWMGVSLDETYFAKAMAWYASATGKSFPEVYEEVMKNG